MIAGLGQKRSEAAKMEEFIRKYHSVERVQWVRRQPSIISGESPCVNVHVAGGGMGRKADADAVIPLTDAEHKNLHQIGIASWCAKYSVTIEWLLEQAAETERRWQEYLAVPRAF